MTHLTDEQREAAIKQAGQDIERCMAVWAAEGCFAARGEAERAASLMKELIAGRSAAQIQRMQAEQAERMALEPGAEKV